MTTPLRRIREKRNLTQKEVADFNNIDTGQYSRIERGVESITPANAEKLSKYFGGAVTELELIYPDRFTTQNSSDAA